MKCIIFKIYGCVIFTLLIFISSCKTPEEQSKVSNPFYPQSENPNSLSEYAFIRYAKILHDFENGRFNSTLADEAFVLGKNFDERGFYEYSEKLYRVCFAYSQTLIVGLSLTNSQVQLKKYEAALEVANRLTVLFPDNPEPEIIIANIYSFQKNQKNLLKTLDKAFKKFPNDESIAIFYASQYKEHEKKILEEFLLKNPKSFDASVTLAKLYLLDGDKKSALKNAKNAYYIDNDNSDVLSILAKIEEQEKNYKEAERYYKLLFNKEPGNNTNALNYINILLTQNKYKESLFELLQLESSSDELVPLPPELSLQIAKLYMQEENYSEAEKRLLNLKKNQKFESEILNFYLAICSERKKNFDKALSYFNNISKSNKYYSEALKGKILILINTKQKMEAETELNQFTVSKESSISDTVFKSSVLSYFSKHKEALVLLEEAIQNNPNAKDLYLKKAELLNYTESKNAAIAYLEKIIEKWPNYAEALNYLGYTLLENKNKHEHAKKLLHKALALQPENGFFLDSLGWYYYKVNNYKTAEKFLLDAIEQEPKEPVILYHLALVQQKLAQHKSALASLEMTSKILADMLPYPKELDPEISFISKNIETKILENKKAMEQE